MYFYIAPIIKLLKMVTLCPTLLFMFVGMLTNSIYTKHRIQSSYFSNTGFKNVHGHVHDLWRIYFHTLHQDLSAGSGWCSGFMLASSSEGPILGFIPQAPPDVMQVVQLSHLSESLDGI